MSSLFCVYNILCWIQTRWASLWASCCPPVGLPDESNKHSNFCRPEPQTDWRWLNSDQMLFDFSSMWNMCPQCWTQCRPWMSSHDARLHRCQSIQSCVWGLVQTCTSIFFFLCPFFVLQNLFPPHKHKTKLKHAVKSKKQTNRQRCNFNPKSSWPMRSSK